MRRLDSLKIRLDSTPRLSEPKACGHARYRRHCRGGAQGGDVTELLGNMNKWLGMKTAQVECGLPSVDPMRRLGFSSGGYLDESKTQKRLA